MEIDRTGYKSVQIGENDKNMDRRLIRIKKDGNWMKTGLIMMRIKTKWRHIEKGGKWDEKGWKW